MGTVGRDDTGLTVERQCLLSTLGCQKQPVRLRPIAVVASGPARSQIHDLTTIAVSPRRRPGPMQLHMRQRLGKSGFPS